jgi:hypothetical protein
MTRETEISKPDRDYHITWYRFDGRDGYLISFMGEPDGCVVDSEGKIPSFQNQKSAILFAASLEIPIVEKELLLDDLDLAQTWVNNKRLRAIDCNNLLTVWNFLDDVSVSVNGNFDSKKKRTNKIYDKIFFGNNLPAITPKGERYEPIWSKAERDIIREVLSLGFNIFRGAVKQQ